jgi:hypothetical protein
VVKPLAQAVEDVGHELTIGHVVPQVPQHVSHSLHLAAVVSHVEFSLHEHVKLCFEVKDTNLALTERLVLDGDPCLARGIWSLMDDLHQLLGDGTEDPRQHDAVEVVLVRRVDAVGEDVVIQRITAEGEEEEVTSAGIDGAGGDRLQDDLDEGVDVRDRCSLGVQMRGHGIVGNVDVVGGNVVVVCGGAGMLLRSSQLAL